LPISRIIHKVTSAEETAGVSDVDLVFKDVILKAINISNATTDGCIATIVIAKHPYVAGSPTVALSPNISIFKSGRHVQWNGHIKLPPLPEHLVRGSVIRPVANDLLHLVVWWELP